MNAAAAASNKNRPTCILCRAEQEKRPIRIGVWLCKYHWRLLVRLARLVNTKMVWGNDELRETYSRLMHPTHDRSTDSA